MNILIVSENFTKGGLETQVYTQFSIMKKNNNFSFAFGKYTSLLDLSDSKVYQNFSFSVNSTVEQFCEDVDRLVDIIKKDNIEVIHVHPFYSIFPAVFAAKITNIPIVYTYHGVISLNFPSKINDNLLFKAIIESEIDKVFSVSQTGIDAIRNFSPNTKTVLIKNAIDVKKYKKHTIKNNKIWALISRIEKDKIDEIIRIISNMDEIDIKKICIYGDGNEVNKLKEYIELYHLEEKVFLMGYKDNLYEELDGKYNGILGSSRVSLEAISMGYPTILLGYGKIAGLIDMKLFNKLKNENFINRGLPEINIKELKLQIQNVYKNLDKRNKLSKMVKNEYSAEKIYKQYIKELYKVERHNVYNISEIYNEICKLKLIEKNEKIYSSRNVYYILKKYVEKETVLIPLKEEFINFDLYYSIIDANN